MSELDANFDEEANENLRLSLPMFDADQANYFVALYCVYDISFEDLAKSFNIRYIRHTSPEELRCDIKMTEEWYSRWAAGLPTGLPTRPGSLGFAVTNIAYSFWHGDGFGEHDVQKLFILATYRQAHEAAIKKADWKDYKAAHPGASYDDYKAAIEKGNHKIDSDSNSVATDPLPPQPASYFETVAEGFLRYEDIRRLSYKDLLKVCFARKKRQDEKARPERTMN
ncbi:MAG: hypothetical protein Q9224_006523 [Gallowayella concinna]